MAGVAGQGRRFSVSEALEAATFAFWEHGYEGTSLKLLTEAMGINPPSLYKAFGSKEDLFFSAIEHYNATYARFFIDAFREEDTALQLVPRILHGAAKHYSNPRFPGGCLVLNATINVAPENNHVAHRLAQLRTDNVERIEEFLDDDHSWRQRDESISSEAAAVFIGAIMQGMSQQARDGRAAAELHDIADLAIVSLSLSAP